MTESIVLTHLARIKVATVARSAELFAMLQERFGYDGDADSVYPFDAEISSNLLDSHFTRMSVKTLQNYAEDSQRGVAFLQGHNWRGTAIGYSLSGEYQDSGDKKRVIAGFYTVYGMQETDNLVKRIKSGLSRDVSVGFNGGSYTCDICGRDIWDWDCRHIPGVEYEEKRGDETYKVISTFTIDDARLSEVSDVFDGSTPDAMILRVQRVAELGGLTPQQIGILENRYRVKLPTKKATVVRDMGNLGPIKKEEPKEREMEVEQDLIKIRTLLKLKDDESIIQGIETLQQRVKELEPQAEEGRQYRVDLIKTALEEGVRAQGNEFDSALYEENLGRSSIAVIKRFTADWKKVADEKLKGGRASTETETREAVVVNGHIPDEAY